MAYIITDACKGCQACVKICPTNAISGARQQIHSINPKHCIDCGACGRVCPFQAVKTQTGEIAQHVNPSQRLIPFFDTKVCVSCGLCITICPVSCLDLEYPDGRTAQDGRPFIRNLKDCIGCQFCDAVCPVGAISMHTKRKI